MMKGDTTIVQLLPKVTRASDSKVNMKFDHGLITLSAGKTGRSVHGRALFNLTYG